MLGAAGQWKKVGRVIRPVPGLQWLSTHAGPAAALQLDDSPLFDIFIAGRDDTNRSFIGVCRIDIDAPTEPVGLLPEAVLNPGRLGAFDDRGVSYPSLVRHGSDLHLYYTGWMTTSPTPFQNHVGLAISQDGGAFERVSEAPILSRTDGDPFSLGSTFVMCEGSRWRMWYTSFESWGDGSSDELHRYRIKYAESEDGRIWRRDDTVAIPLDKDESCIARPSVLFEGGRYHMWYSVRGKRYRIGYAHSMDGIRWTRRDDLAGISVSASGWDSEEVSYPHVFRYGSSLYLLYCGNGYGKTGLGLATRPLSGGGASR